MACSPETGSRLRPQGMTSIAWLPSPARSLQRNMPFRPELAFLDAAYSPRTDACLTGPPYLYQCKAELGCSRKKNPNLVLLGCIHSFQHIELVLAPISFGSIGKLRHPQNGSLLFTPVPGTGTRGWPGRSLRGTSLWHPTCHTSTYHIRAMHSTDEEHASSCLEQASRMGGHSNLSTFALEHRICIAEGLANSPG